MISQRVKEKDGISEKTAWIAAVRKLLIITPSIYKNHDTYHYPETVRAWHATPHLIPSFLYNSLHMAIAKNFILVIQLDFEKK